LKITEEGKQENKIKVFKFLQLSSLNEIVTNYKELEKASTYKGVRSDAYFKYFDEFIVKK
jgi:hypothetical protein